MSEVIIHQPPVGEQIELVKTLSPSGLLPESFRNNPANLMYAVQYANALGLAPIHAITGIAVIKGKPTASADLMAAIVRRAGHKLRVTGDDTYAEAVLIRKDDPSFEYRARWDREKAQQAGLTNNPTYSKYPGAMYRARAVSEVVRMGASDAMYGLIYTPEDMGEVANEPGAPEAAPATTRVSRRKPTPEPDPEPETADDSPSDAQRRKMFAALGDLNLTDRADILEYVSGIAGRDIESSNDLTRDEVSRVIDSLETPTNKENA